MSFPYPNQRFSTNLGLGLYGMDEVLADDMNILDQAFGSGSSINVNGTLVTSPNLSDTLPAPPLGNSNVLWQFDANGNISGYVTPGGSSFLSQLKDVSVPSIAEGQLFGFSYFSSGFSVAPYNVLFVAEDSSSVVTLTLSTVANLSIGTTVGVNNVASATWLNGQIVNLLSVVGNTVTYVDPTGNGFYPSTADTGNIFLGAWVNETGIVWNDNVLDVNAISSVPSLRIGNQADLVTLSGLGTRSDFQFLIGGIYTQYTGTQSIIPIRVAVEGNYPSDNGGAQIWQYSGLSKNTGTHSIGALGGMQVFTTHASSASLGSLFGVSAAVDMEIGSGNVSNSFGVSSAVSSESTSSISNAVAYFGSVALGPATVALAQGFASAFRVDPNEHITTYADFYAYSPNVSGSNGQCTNCYGLYIEDQRSANVTNAWGVYVAADNSFFGGSIDTATGYRVNNAATSGHVLRGNGTNFVDAQLQYADIGGTVPTPPSGTVLWSALGNAAADLTLANAGFNTTFNQTSATNWSWANTTASTGATGFVDNATDLSTPSAWTNTNCTVITAPAGGPVGSTTAISAAPTQHAHVTAGVVAGSTISFFINFPNINAALSEFYFGCSAAGVGAGLRIDARTSNKSGMFSSSTFTSVSVNGSSVLNITAGVWYPVVINIDASGTKASWSFNGILQEANIGVFLGGPFIGVYGDTGTNGAVFADIVVASASGVSSPLLNLNSTYWNGASSAADGWALQNVVSNSPNGTSSLTLTHTGSSGLAKFSLLNNAAATSLGVNKNSPALGLSGKFFSGGSSAEDMWSLQNVISTGHTSVTVTNVAENASNVVTLTITGGTLTTSDVITLTGLTAATWLNNVNVTPSTANATTLVFTDPTLHGTLASTPETGQVTQANPISALVISHAGSTNAQIQTLSGTAFSPAYSFAAAPGVGMFYNGSVVIRHTSAATCEVGAGGANLTKLTGGGANSLNCSNALVYTLLCDFALPAGQQLRWGSTANAAATPDVGIARIGVAALAIGDGTLNAAGSLALTNLSGNLVGSTIMSALATPAAPTITKSGANTGTTWGYKVVAKDINGNVTAASAEGTISNGATILIASQNIVTINQIAGAVTYDVYRTTVGTTPSTTGLLVHYSVAQFGALGASIHDAGQIVLTAVATSVGGVAVYTGNTNATGTVANSYVGQTFVVAGFSTSANNGTFICTASTTTNLTLANASASAETHAATATSFADGTTAPVANTTGVFTLLNPTVATVSTTNASPTSVFSAQYWNGAASAADTWTIGSSLAAGTNGASTLMIAHAGSTGTAGIQVPRLGVNNAPSATYLGIYQQSLSNTANQAHISGTTFGTNGNGATVNLGTNGVVGAGSSNLGFTTFVCVGDSVGAFNSKGKLILTTLGWNSDQTATTDMDTGISRLGAASLAVGNGTAGSFAGSLKLTTLNNQGGSIVNRAAKAGDYTSTATDYVLVFTATAMLTLDSAAAVSGTTYRIKLSTAAAGGSALTVSPNNSKTIDGAATQVITTLGGAIDVVYDGTANWEVF